MLLDASYAGAGAQKHAIAQRVRGNRSKNYCCSVLVDYSQRETKP
jgi:hypothetical protein